MTNLIIGFDSKSPFLTSNLFRALQLVDSQDENTKLKIYPSDQYSCHDIIKEAEKINLKFNSVTIVLNNDLKMEQLKLLTVMIAYLNKPFALLIENLPLPSQAEEKEMIVNICNKAHTVFTAQRHTSDTLAHHYHVETETHIPIQYGYWPSSEPIVNIELQNQMAIYVESDTIENLEHLILALPRLKKINPHLVIDIYTSSDITIESQWLIRNKLLANKLLLKKVITWNILSNQNISDLARRYALSVFTWSAQYGGNPCLRFETMAAGGAVVCLNDMFAQDLPSGMKALLILQNDTNSTADKLISLYSNQALQREIRESAGLAGESYSWLALAKKIKQKLNIIQQLGTQPKTLQYDLMLSPHYNPRYNKEIKKIRSYLESDKISDTLWLLNKIKEKSELTDISLKLAYLKRIEMQCCQKDVKPDSLFELSFALYQLAKNNESIINTEIANIYEKMAPMVDEDYMLIELLYQLIQYKNSPTPNLINKIKERSNYIAQTVAAHHNPTNKNGELIKTAATLFETANLLNDSKINQSASEFRTLIEKAFFSQGGYKPAVHLAPNEIMKFTYWISFCLQNADDSKDTDTTLLLEQMSAWFFGFNDKNKVYFDSENGFCSIQTRDIKQSTEVLIQESLYFWLFQKNYQKAVIVSYYKPAK